MQYIEREMGIISCPCLCSYRRCRCYNGELYACGKKLDQSVSRIHPGDCITLTLNATSGTLAIKINNADYGIIFTQLPPCLHFFVLFYNYQPPRRSVRCISCRRLDISSSSSSSSSSISLSTSVSVENTPITVDQVMLFIHQLTMYE